MGRMGLCRGQGGAGNAVTCHRPPPDLGFVEPGALSFGEALLWFVYCCYYFVLFLF
jgi:hypothetical protein